MTASVMNWHDAKNSVQLSIAFKEEKYCYVRGKNDTANGVTTSFLGLLQHHLWWCRTLVALQLCDSFTRLLATIERAGLLSHQLWEQLLASWWEDEWSQYVEMQIRIVLGTTTEEGTEWQAERGLETTKISLLRHWVLATKTRAQIREWFQLGPNRRIPSSARHGQAPGNSVCSRQNSPENACSPGAKRLSNSPVHAETREKSGGIFHTKRSFSQLAPEFPRFRWKNADYVNWDEESSSSRVDEGVPCSLRSNGKANLLSLWGILNDDYCRNFQSSARWDTPLPM